MLEVGWVGVLKMGGIGKVMFEPRLERDQGLFYGYVHGKNISGREKS